MTNRNLYIDIYLTPNETMESLDIL